MTQGRNICCQIDTTTPQSHITTSAAFSFQGSVGYQLAGTLWSQCSPHTYVMLTELLQVWKYHEWYQCCPFVSNGWWCRRKGIASWLNPHRCQQALLLRCAHNTDPGDSEKEEKSHDPPISLGRTQGILYTSLLLILLSEALLWSTFELHAWHWLWTSSQNDACPLNWLFIWKYIIIWPSREMELSATWMTTHGRRPAHKLPLSHCHLQKP